MIGISGPLDIEVDGLERIDASREHVQLVLTDRSTLTQRFQLGVVSARTWRLADLGSKHMLLKEAIGWGNMPEPMVREDIRTGRLVLLDLPDCKGGPYRLQAVHRTDTPPGPAGRFLFSHFEAQAEEDDMTYSERW